MIHKMPGRAGCRVFVMCCLDYRYIDSTMKFIKKKFGTKMCDLKTDAGGVKTLIKGQPKVRAWILTNLRLAKTLHGFKTVILVNHQDCSAYGGSAAFLNDRAETLYHVEQLTKTAAFLRSRFRDLAVRAFYAYRGRSKTAFIEVK